jgi:hypothetical protein
MEITVTLVEERRGDGGPYAGPIRLVQRYYLADGTLLTERDPWRDRIQVTTYTGRIEVWPNVLPSGWSYVNLDKQAQAH